LQGNFKKRTALSAQGFKARIGIRIERIRTGGTVVFVGGENPTTG
jgi:hypothetical protein